ncbi:MAG: hypothetical protein HYU74_12550 [Dechloromonas sp.]|nr:hypothetical protein [Dechloromonas sp.]
MTANTHEANLSMYPEHLAPALHWHGLGGPMNGQRSKDARCDFDAVMADQRTAWEWAAAKHLAVLSVNADRNGAYLCLAASPTLATLFGDECSRVTRIVQGALATELWMGCIGHIRVFWREVKCLGH